MVPNGPGRPLDVCFAVHGETRAFSWKYCLISLSELLFRVFFVRVLSNRHTRRLQAERLHPRAHRFLPPILSRRSVRCWERL